MTAPTALTAPLAPRPQYVDARRIYERGKHALQYDRFGNPEDDFLSLRDMATNEDGAFDEDPAYLFQVLGMAEAGLAPAEAHAAHSGYADEYIAAALNDAGRGTLGAQAATVLVVSMYASHQLWAGLLDCAAVRNGCVRVVARRGVRPCAGARAPRALTLTPPPSVLPSLRRRYNPDAGECPIVVARGGGGGGGGPRPEVPCGPPRRSRESSCTLEIRDAAPGSEAAGSRRGRPPLSRGRRHGPRPRGRDRAAISGGRGAPRPRGHGTVRSGDGVLHNTGETARSWRCQISRPVSSAASEVK